MIVFFVAGFIAPLLIVAMFSFLPDKTFGFHGQLSFENYQTIFRDNYYKSFLWSFGLATATTAINLVLGYPIAYGLAKVFGRHARLITFLAILPLFIADNVRLFGWSMFLLKGSGILAGSMNSLFGVELSTLLYGPGTVLFGLIYIYLPFTVFPMVLGVSMIPKEQVEAAGDLGANRFQIFRDVEIPIALPGISIGALLTFMLVIGSVLESQILGGESITVITLTIQRAFTYAQNWPLGSALTMLVIVLTMIITVIVMRRIDLNSLIGGSVR